MKASVYVLLILLGVGALLNTFENHFCKDTDGLEIFVSADSFDSLQDTSESTPDNHNAAEPCHFGHCVHGSRIHADFSWDFPQGHFSSESHPFYKAQLLSGIVRFALRPPAPLSPV